MKSIVDLTYVEYPSEDGIFGFAVSLVSLTPIALFVGLFSIAVNNRDLRYALLALGLLLSTIANEIAKKIIKQDRPALSHKKGYGMPSDHSQFMMFWLISIIVYFRAHPVLRRWFYISLSISNAILTASVMYSRYYLGVHSLEQIFVGSLSGLILGYTWTHLIIRAELTPAFRAAQTAIDRFWRNNFTNKIV